MTVDDLIVWLLSVHNALDSRDGGNPHKAIDTRWTRTCPGDADSLGHTRELFLGYTRTYPFQREEVNHAMAFGFGYSTPIRTAASSTHEWH